MLNQIPKYYAEWWNNARTNPGTVLTKKKRHQVELAQQEQQKQKLQATIFALQTSAGYQNTLQLEEEIQDLKQKNTDWEARYNELEHLNTQQIQALTLLAEKRKTDLTQEKKALFALAKQKIKGKKEAQTLLNQLTENWNTDRASLEQQIQAKDQQITTQNEAHQDLLAQQKNSLKTIEKLEQINLNLEADLQQSQQEFNLARQESQNLQAQLTQSQLKDQELNRIIQETNTKLTNTEAELTTTQQKLTQAQEQTREKQDTINTLRQEKAEQLEQITHLTQELTEKTQTIANQLTQINKKDTKLTQQRQVLEQLLTNREERLQELGGGE